MEKPKNPDEELVGGDGENKNWKGILIALLVILLICGLVIIAVIAVTPKKDDEVLGEPFTLEDLLGPDSEFKLKRFSATWLEDQNVFIFRTEKGQINATNVDKNETEMIMDEAIFVMDEAIPYNCRSTGASHYSVSADLRFVLLACEIEPIYHHSFTAKYVIYDRQASDPGNNLIAFPHGVDRNEWADKKLHCAVWSPQGHELTFVYGNTLYYQPNPFTTPVRITDNKKGKSILHGRPDWLYEEEILHSNVAHWLSPDGRFVAYIQFNDTNVPLQSFPLYGDPADVNGGMIDVRYPKAGDTKPNMNPTVKLYIADTQHFKGSHRLISPPDEFTHSDHYIMLVRWRDSLHIVVSWSNRAQNKTIVTVCHILSTDCRYNLVETHHEGKGWVVIDDLRFVRKGQEYLTILPQQIGESGYWNHLALVSSVMDSGGVKTFLTHGAWDVLKVVGYNEAESTAYYLGTNGDPRTRHLFSLKLPSEGKRTHTPHCMTCKLGDQCQYIGAEFSPSGQYYIEGCLGPGVPHYTLKSTINNKTTILENNSILAAKLAKKARPKKEYFEFKNRDGDKIYGQLYLPPMLKKEHITLYPVLVYTYAGPETQAVTEEFKLDWSTYLASSENVIYASFDGRGSAGRGNRFMHAVYRKLGQLEVQDQIDGGSYLKKNLQDFPFVDKERIAIWGWSYGGFVVTHVLGDEKDTTFRCGVAVAPVTDWRYYDTAYTERYMGMATSTDNYRGYDDANVSAKAANFKDKGFLLVHGTADDNVHFQNSAQLMKALTEADVTYQVQVYPDKNHQLSGIKTTRHLHRTMIKFLKKECWGGGKPHDAKPLAVEPNKKIKS